MESEESKMIFFDLFIQFFKIGLFAVGGGQATIPFLYELCNHFPWFSTHELIDMIAISESTPGPIGINMATYAGFNAAGILGGITATLSLVLPSVVIIILISKALKKFRTNPYVENIFSILRPCVVGLIASAALTVFSIAILNVDAWKESGNFMEVVRFKECILFIVLFLMALKWKKHPIFYLTIAMVVGIALQL